MARRKIQNYLVPAVAPLFSSDPVYMQGLNAEQREAAQHRSGPMVVMAQAGSGKTKTLISLVANFVHSEVSPEKIFAVTFSKKAADEMDHRGRGIGLSANFATWHRFALSVLKEDQTHWGTWQVDESDRAKYAVKEALSYKHLDWKDADLGKVRGFIGKCKADYLFPEDEGTMVKAKAEFGAKASFAVKAYAISQDMIENQGLLTFDDMLMFTCKHLHSEENRARWAGKFEWVLQDEAQDSNRVQTLIAELLTKESRNYCVVGDPAQSIYGFRGSSPEAITGFSEKYPNAKIVCMNRNYRSCKAIVRVANNVIRPAKIKLPVDMIAEREEEGSARVVAAQNLDDEASEFLGYVKGLQAEGKPLSSVTCLFRTNAQSRALEEALLGASVPYLIIGGTSFYERKEVKDLLGYLRVASGTDKDGEGLKRCLNAPFRFLGGKFVDRVTAVARPGMDWMQAVSIASGQAGIQARQRASVVQWAKLIEDIQADIKEAVDPGTILNRVVMATKFLEWLSQDEGSESIESSHAANVRELIRVAGKFATVKDLLDYIEKSIKASQRQKKEQTAGGDRVLLMSIHRSKGLEWPNVWVVGCNDKILPHAFGDIEEERRLFYVAVTRARDNLTLSYVKNLTSGEGMKPGYPSEFLSDAGFNLTP